MTGTCHGLVGSFGYGSWLYAGHSGCGRHTNKKPNEDASVACVWEHTMRCCMSHIISRRLGVPTILGIVSGNAASISALRVLLNVGAMLYSCCYPVDADGLALFLLIEEISWGFS